MAVRIEEREHVPKNIVTEYTLRAGRHELSVTVFDMKHAVGKYPPPREAYRGTLHLNSTPPRTPDRQFRAVFRTAKRLLLHTADTVGEPIETSLTTDMAQLQRFARNGGDTIFGWGKEPRDRLPARNNYAQSWLISIRPRA